MDQLEFFVLCWLASLMLLVAASAWWQWFSHSPNWFIPVIALVLIGLIASVVMIVRGMPVWTGWTGLVLCNAVTVAAIVGVIRSDRAQRRS